MTDELKQLKTYVTPAQMDAINAYFEKEGHRHHNSKAAMFRDAVALLLEQAGYDMPDDMPGWGGRRGD